MSKNRKKQESTITYTKKTALSYHDTGYYQAMSDNVSHYAQKQLDKILLRTNWKDDVSEILKECTTAGETRIDPCFKVLQRIYERNIDVAKKEEEPPIHQDLINLVAHPSTLILAYRTIRKNKGALTKGAQIPHEELKKMTEEKRLQAKEWDELPDGMSTEVLSEMSKLIKTGKWKWGYSQKIYITKPGRPISEKRPLTIPSFMDRMVQEAIRMVLEAIYEPWFELMNCSFGFRANKGCHDAIVSIKRDQTQNLHMAIEGDIKGAYDKVDRKILINILKKRIKDKKFIKLIEERLKLKLFDTQSKKYENTSEGIPQGGIDSPYLFNIYMMEFDKYIKNEIKIYIDNINTIRYRKKRTRKQIQNKEQASKLSRAPLNKNYTRIITIRNSLNETRVELKEKIKESKKQKDKNRLNEYIMKKHNILKKIRLCNHRMQQVQSICNSRKLLRYHYVRYADDWILLTNAPQSICDQIKKKIEIWLQENLKATLAVEKTIITDMRRTHAKFLGFELRLTNTRRQKKSKITGQINPNRKKVIRSNSWKIKTYPDRQRLINRLHMKAYCDKKGFPREIPWLSGLEAFTIVEKYNSVILGISNYYAEYIDNTSDLGRWLYIIKWSCLKTLAQKFSTNLRGIFYRFGTDNTVTIVVTLTDEKGNEYKKTYKLLTHKEAVQRSKKLERYKELMRIHGAIEKKEFPTYQLIDPQRTPRIADSDFLERINWVKWRTVANLSLPCSICGSFDNVEMHHVRHIRKSNYHDIPETRTWEKMMSLRNRKQIPLCAEHHRIIHSGKYDGPSLNKMIDVQKLYDNRIIHPESFVKVGKIYTSKNLEEKGWELTKSPSLE